MDANDAGASAWSAAEQFNPMGAAADQDFGSLIDFDHLDLDLDFSIDYSAGNGNEHDSTRQLTELADSLDLQNQFSPAVSHPHEHHNGAAGLSQHQQSAMGGHGMPPTGGNGFYDFTISPYSQTNAPPFSQAQDQNQMYRQHVPLTPNSSELHGEPSRYLQHMDPQQALYDQRYQLRKEDGAFTPLVSPAVTPHEGNFRMQEYPGVPGVPGAYFSPLTSPALNAQHHQQTLAHSGHYTTSGSSTGTSPIDVDMDLLGEAAMTKPDQGRKLRSNKRSATGRVRQSPIVKPGRRKAAVTSFVPPKEVSELVEEAQRTRSHMLSSSGLDVPRGRDRSETDSISPEPLSDMGPPPKPSSTTNSPAMIAQRKKHSGLGVAPATPASLMRIHPSPTFGGTPDLLPMLDDFALPEASLEKPPLPHTVGTIRDDDQETPRLTARKTPKLTPLSTPSAGAALYGKPSPMLSAISSPTSPAFSMGSIKRVDSKLGRGTKKRNSIAPSNLVSPALRPKISPSIKPLLPENSLSDDTHALLLASKSNYQNILDGTTVPGVVYPTSLSTNLTSKRTSHKIAEQGRRNRINTALQEMQALIPSPHLAARDAKSPDSSSTAAQLSNSKAAKVESAIDYIRTLKQQCSEKDRLLDQKDREMEALRKELAALRRSSSATSSVNAVESDVQMTTEADLSTSPHTENAT